MTRAANVLVRPRFYLALTLATVASVAAAQPPSESSAPDPEVPRPDPHAWAATSLARMAAAVDDLYYEGTLVYLADNRLETLHIVHSVAGGQAEERLVSLSGPVRAVTRHQDEVTCVLSGDHPISVKRKPAIPDLLRARAIDPAVLAANYTLYPLGETRVAGRDTDVVGVIPRDDYRYGYRFYLDRQTGLPLKSDLMGTSGEPIEQIMFAAVQVDTARAKSAVRPDSGDALAAAPDGNPEPLATGSGAGGASPWRFEALPPGFAVRMHDSWPEGTEGKAEHFLVTDHLASVSVFVEGAGQGALTGATRIGAVHAAGGQVGGHQVTVVGQVPAETVAAVLAGLRHEGGEQR
jgi:sigma-E factor negative regulatory protein RseB